jgi:hypothetical protein
MMLIKNCFSEYLKSVSPHLKGRYHVGLHRACCCEVGFVRISFLLDEV